MKSSIRPKPDLSWQCTVEPPIGPTGPFNFAFKLIARIRCWPRPPTHQGYQHPPRPPPNINAMPLSTTHQIFLIIVLNPVFVLHSLNFTATTFCHREAALVSIAGYPEGIDSYVQPHFIVEDALFGVSYTLVMVLLHRALCGFSKGSEKESAEEAYWE